MINKKVIGLVVFICGLGGFLLMAQFFNMLSGDDSCSPKISFIQVAFAHNPEAATVVFTDNGVFPACSVVVSGGSVIWVNNTSKSIQVSSDPHPVHTDNSEISEGKFVLELKSGQSARVVLT